MDDGQIYYIATEHGTAYITHDPVRSEAVLRGGRRVTISSGKLSEFMHTARLLGMRTGKL